MWRISLVALVVVCASAVVMAQGISTPEQLDAVMKRVGPAQQALNKAIQSMAYADAKTQLGIVRQNLTQSESFWVVKKKDDAVKMSKEVMSKIGALDKMLSTPSPDNAAVTAAFKEVGGACRNCHMAYREQDKNENYILKPGSVQ